jgi:hypothetical protein
MANTKAQRDVEARIREEWLPLRFSSPFKALSLPLVTGGSFAFDAVSEDGSIVVSISTSGRRTRNGKHGSGKLHKIHSDVLFLTMLQDVKRRILLFTEQDMHDFVEAEQKRGRLPKEIEVMLASIPDDWRKELEISREQSISEVTRPREEP